MENVYIYISICFQLIYTLVDVVDLDDTRDGKILQDALQIHFKTRKKVDLEVYNIKTCFCF